MENIIQYGIATANDCAKLAGYVNEQITQGWQPFGNIYITVHQNQTFIHQPMVMYDLKNKNNSK